MPYSQPPLDNFEPTFQEKVLQALARIDMNTQALHSHTQSSAKLETQIGQLAAAFSGREGEKLLCQPESNPRGQFVIESFNIPEAFSEHAKSIMTLRSEKVIEHTSKIN